MLDEILYAVANLNGLYSLGICNFISQYWAYDYLSIFGIQVDNSEIDTKDFVS